jgi:hypothetical protein
MMATLGKVAAIAVTFILLWMMRTSLPTYDEVTGPIPVAAAAGADAMTDNLAIDAGALRLAKKIQFKAFGRVQELDTDGVWMVIPVRLQAQRESTAVRGATWQASDGRNYAASLRAENAEANLLAKSLQPGLKRSNLLVFEMPEDAAREGVLLLSEQAFPRLTAQLRLGYAKPPTAAPLPLLDLDMEGLHGSR